MGRLQNRTVFTTVAFAAIMGLAQAQTANILDPLAVVADGDPAHAVIAATIPLFLQTEKCDVVVIGAGLGGSAAAMTVAYAGHHVCMTDILDRRPNDISGRIRPG